MGTNDRRKVQRSKSVFPEGLVNKSCVSFLINNYNNGFRVKYVMTRIINGSVPYSYISVKFILGSPRVNDHS